MGGSAGDEVARLHPGFAATVQVALRLRGTALALHCPAEKAMP